jgi:UPF0176 protein
MVIPFQFFPPSSSSVLFIAKEGVNGTFEGENDAIETYVKDLLSRPGFEDIHIKRSEGTGKAFPKLSIKVRQEIVATHLPPEDDVDPRVTTGKYLQPEELHEWITSGKKFYIIDMRNDYEQEVGHFKNSIMSGMKNFYDLQRGRELQWQPRTLQELPH